MPKLLLITASSPAIRRARRPRILNFQQITMPYLAARVPADWEVRHVDEEASEIDWCIRPDVVAITFHTPSAPHAYTIADRFRAQGAVVALGGPHVTLLPDEAALHADSIFVGEAEACWEDFLNAVRQGEHARVYRRTSPPDLAGAPEARKDLYHRQDYTSGRLFASRGCPHTCEFCSIVVMYPGRMRRRPVEEVAAEYASFRGKRIILWDDNLGADREYALRLFRALAPHRKWWSSQANVKIAHDEELLAEAARSGCKQLFLGLESLSQGSVDAARKSFNRVDSYAAAIRAVHAHGIAVQAGIVFGFDQDTPEIFDRTLEFLEETGVQNATFNILTPYPGTPLFRRLDAEGRILTTDWSRYDGRTAVVFQPSEMTAEQLLTGFQSANQRFYSLPSIARRIARSPVQMWWTLPLNLAYAAAWPRGQG